MVIPILTMNQKILIVQSNFAMGKFNHQEKVDDAIEEYTVGWEIQSVSTHSCASPNGTGSPNVFWTTTILLKLIG